MKIVIFGSRELPNAELAKSYIDRALELSGWHVTEVVSGTARGADTIGEDWDHWDEAPEGINDALAEAARFIERVDGK